ncbi:MAG TPA: HAD family acid phosphatase [Terracidiphilus sp.]|nr:HAD family acid phosphatase [Terracidiphilus sp.]
MRGVFFAAIAGIALVWNSASAQQAGSRDAALVPGERIANLDKLKGELRQYHACTCTCGCYARDLDMQADRAIAFLRQRAAHRGAKEKLAMVLDIDETTLSNYEEMVKVDFTYNAKAFNAWEDSAEAPAIPGTLRIYREARRLGVSVFFLTGRPEAQRAATERNLRSQGFVGWQQLILRPHAQASATALAYKSEERATIETEGYRIVLNVGDQWSDLRGKPEAEYSVKYPDPFYFIK